jgi:phage-related protein
VPAQHEQLFHVYEQNDYSCFPSFVTTDLYLQLFHLYFDCMLREIEENKLHAMMTKLSLSTYLKLYQQANSTDNEEIKSLATYDAAFFAIAYELFTGASIGTSDFQAITKPEVKRVMDSKNDFSDFI